MADIFLSYQRQDHRKVHPLAEALQACGWSVWWDTRIGAGESWDRVIEAELAAARCVVVVWSNQSIESDWVRQEAREGRARKCLIPVTIDGALPPLEFRNVQTVDLSAWRGDQNDGRFSLVCAAVERHAGDRKQPAARPLAGALKLDPQAISQKSKKIATEESMEGRRPTYDGNNIFAKILRGELPAHKVYEDAETLAFMDIMPRCEGHTLVIPKTPARNILDASPAQLAACMRTAQKVAAAAMKAFGAHGITLQQFNERAGGQVVFHLHFHILPRLDGVTLGPPASKVEKAEVLAANAEKIKRALA